MEILILPESLSLSRLWFRKLNYKTRQWHVFLFINKGCTMPYFMKRAAESKDPVERLKYVMSTVFSGFYYLNLFLKPVTILFYLSLTQSLVKLFKVIIQMVLISIVNKFHIIPQSVISLSLDQTILSDTTAIMPFLHMLDLTP